jgi:hypothetical protein
MNARAELQGRLAPAELATMGPDLLAFLDAHRVYLEIGPSFSAGSGYISYDKDVGGWEARFYNGARYELVEYETLYSTLIEALEALRAKWMQ